MGDPKSIFVVVRPDGHISDDAIGFTEEAALAGLISSWLPRDVFGNYQMGRPYGGGVLYPLWKAMSEKGWTIKKIPIPADATQQEGR